MWLAEALDVDYLGRSRFVSDRIVFGFNEWITVLKDRHPYGTAIIMEEPQSYFNSRMFASKTNLDAISKFSTGRIFQYLYILTYPSFERIDSQIRERVHFLIQTDGINQKDKINFWKPFEILPNFRPNLPVYRKPLSVTINGSRYKLRCSSGRPSDDLWDDYYSKSREWKTLVKEGRLTSSGDLLGSVQPKVDGIISRANRFRERREQLARKVIDEFTKVGRVSEFYDEANKVRLNRIVGSANVSRTIAQRVKYFLESGYGNNIVDRLHEEELSVLDERQ